eukprot:CAMPEP_0181040660 /NCGR_PEP_ID=MMETSP1070-20121207/11171_1 /TAXON_ID=265543 /ORGANISM="Minutocellus polymorphus, Strain NH13" /LENGTH=115 /DNA_ID=CAMNT_0023118693 /DNA_START=200 /DNA_END=544 /DNA_ORIENTATION=+
MTRLFLLEQHIRIAIFDGVGDGIDDGRAATIVTISGHLDGGGFCRKDGVVGVGVGGGNPPQAGVVRVPVQPHKILVEAQGNEGIGSHSGGGEEENQRSDGLHLDLLGALGSRLIW